MSSKCAYCSRLTVESLVELACQKGKPGQVYYKHHASFDDLETAASSGYDLCHLVLRCLQISCLDGEKYFPRPETWAWGENPVHGTSYEKAKGLKRSPVRLRIELRDVDVHSQPGLVKVLDSIVFRVGEEGAEDPDDFVELSVGLRAKEGIEVVHNHQACPQANCQSPYRLHSSVGSIFDPM